MHAKVLPAGSRQLLAKLNRSKAPALDGWTLAGGTGLALQAGHRVSEDFDFFRSKGIDIQGLREVFGQIGSYETLQEAEHTLTILMRGVKISFFSVTDPFIYGAKPYNFFSVADVREIALMKLVAISNRGSRKDFVDLYTILRSGPKLSDYFNLLPRKYGKSRINEYHILKSLTYFADAEKEPMPVMLEPFSWKECKSFFVREAHAIVLP